VQSKKKIIFPQSRLLVSGFEKAKSQSDKGTVQCSYYLGYKRK